MTRGEALVLLVLAWLLVVAGAALLVGPWGLVGGGVALVLYALFAPVKDGKS